jgi:hypothetical protein
LDEIVFDDSLAQMDSLSISQGVLYGPDKILFGSDQMGFPK